MGIFRLLVGQEEDLEDQVPQLSDLSTGFSEQSLARIILLSPAAVVQGQARVALTDVPSTTC